MDWVCLSISAAALVHYSCLCNFMPNCASLKIRITSAACVAASASLLCGSFIGPTEPSLAALAVAMIAHDLARWLDGVHICKMYGSSQNEEK